MTELEELLQDDEPATIEGTYALLDKCCADLSKLMEVRGIRPCIHAKNLFFGLHQSRAMLWKVYHHMNAIFHPEQYPTKKTND